MQRASGSDSVGVALDFRCFEIKTLKVVLR
jgi:hypothetical protein